MTRAILTLNSGSSSIRFAVFALDGPAAPAVSGKIDGIGDAPRLVARDAAGETLLDHAWPAADAPDHAALLGELLERAGPLWGDRDLAAVGHRIVHGGDFDGPRIADDAGLEALEALCPLAPLHQPQGLAGIRAVAAMRPDLKQVACFDTAFHWTMPDLATRFALPRRLHDAGVRRYGFHGLSYDHVARRLREVDPALAQGRVIAAHLGAGASLCAMRDGRSIDTTMGFTALDGLVMATRCGALDPGVLIHLQTQEGMDAAALEDLLYRRSGLLGVSGISGDVRILLASDAPEAEEALSLFAWRAAREAGALMSSLGGLDGLVFTAGVGENAPDIRARICAHLDWAGVTLDAAANARNAPFISAPDSKVTVRVIPADEERMIVMQTVAVSGEAP